MRHRNAALGLSLATLMALALRRPTPIERHIGREVVRLQAHFDSVDGELRKRDVSHLTAEQRAARSELISWLRDYRDGKSFPLNDGVAPRMVPIFRDSRGVLCAMAYLIDRSRRRDIVDTVAASRNTSTIHDLADDPRLVAWLDSTGLTVDEAARIQPAYNPPGPPTVIERGVASDYAIASLAFSGTAIAATTINFIAPSQMSGIMGVMTGAIALMTGVSRLDGSTDTKRLATANIAVGAVSLVSAIRGFTVRKPVAGPVTGSRARFDNITIAPSMTEALGRPQFGLGVRARF